MRRAMLVALMAVGLMSGPASGRQSIADKLGEIAATLQATSTNEAGNLDGRQFEIQVPGVNAQNTLEVSPASAFRVDKLTGDRFRVTIVDGKSLVIGGPIPRFSPVGLKIVSINNLDASIDFGAKIQGAASCTYAVKFNVVGGPPIDLSTIGSDYEMSWSTDNDGALESIEQRGPGLIVTRKSGSQGKVALKLKLKAKVGSEVLESAGVDLPACSTSAPQTQTMAADPDPKACLTPETVTTVSCDNCGPLRIWFSTTFTNRCAKRVRCETRYTLQKQAQGGGWNLVDEDDGWVAVAPNNSYNGGEVTLAYSPWYSPFRTTGPGLSNCRFE